MSSSSNSCSSRHCPICGSLVIVIVVVGIAQSVVVVVGLAVIAAVVVVDGGGDLSADVTGDESHLNLVQNQAFHKSKNGSHQGSSCQAPGA